MDTGTGKGDKCGKDTNGSNKGSVKGMSKGEKPFYVDPDPGIFPAVPVGNYICHMVWVPQQQRHMILIGMDDLPRITITNNYTSFTIREYLATHTLESFERICDEYIWALEKEEALERITVLEVRERVRRQQAIELERDIINAAKVEFDWGSEDRLVEEINNFEVTPEINNYEVTPVFISRPGDEDSDDEEIVESDPDFDFWARDPED